VSFSNYLMRDSTHLLHAVHGYTVRRYTVCYICFSL